MAASFDQTSDDRSDTRMGPLRFAAEVAWLGLLFTSALLTVGLPLAVAGQFRPAIVFPATAAVALVSRRVLSPPVGWSRELTSGDSSSGAVLVMMAVVILSALGNMYWAGQHHATNRDPGVYLESGLWLGQHGSLLIDGRTGPFLDDPALRGGGSGFNEIADGSGRLVSQFPHGTAVVVAAGEQLGGIRLATRVGGLLTALAGILLWMLGRRFVGDWWSTLGVAVFSLDIVTIHFARDTFSEPLAAVLIIGLMAVILWSDRPSHWAFAGLLTGLAVAARIDSIVVVLGVSLVVLMASWARHKSAITLVAGLSVGFPIAMVDLVHRSPDYLSDKWPVFRQAMVAAMAVIVATAVVIVFRERLENSALPARLRRFAESAARPGVAAAAGTAVTVAILALLLFRPHFQQLHGGLNEHIRGLQQRDGLAVDGTRTYGESSLRWLTWYFGWPLVILGAAGAGLATRVVMLRRSVDWWLLGAMAAPVTILYLQSPRISGDQIWAMRRFVPVTIPLLVLLALHAAKGVCDAFRGRARMLVAGALVLALTFPAALATAPILDDQTLWWSTASLADLCDHLPADSAVLVSSVVDFGDQLIRPLSRECGVPSARGDLPNIEIGRLTSEWADEGRRMVVLTSVYDPPTGLAPLESVGLHQRHLAQVVEHRPDYFEDGILGVIISESVGPSGGR